MITFATLTNQKIVAPSPNGKFFAVEAHYFVNCHREKVARIAFDLDFYLRRYPDIQQALDAGAITSAHEHYITRGYYEHRMPYPINVNEDWYLDSYEDIRQAVAASHFESGQQHFDVDGFREGRLPFAHFALKTLP